MKILQDIYGDDINGSSQEDEGKYGEVKENKVKDLV